MRRATLDQAGEILQLARQKGLSRAALQEILDSGFLADLFVGGVIDRSKRQAFRDLLGLERIYVIRQERDMTWQEMVELGRYDEVKQPLIGNLDTVLPAGRHDLYLVPAEGLMRQEVEARLKKPRLRFADLGHLLALGITYPQLQIDYKIASLKLPRGLHDDEFNLAVLYKERIRNAPSSRTLLMFSPHDLAADLPEDLYVLAIR
jgi:hypothetical protein